MILDLSKFFLKLKDEAYCIIKVDDKLPNYIKGSDIDFFCYNLDSIIKVILDVGNHYVDDNIEISITNLGEQVYVDFIYKKSAEIEFRFDLYSQLPSYKNTLIKPAFFESVIENRITVNIEVCNIFVPCPIDDNILRYIEYQEWYGVRPDKIKHINYILDNTSDKIENNNFLKKLHHYTKLPLVEAIYPVVTNSKSILKLELVNFIRKNHLIKKIASKLPEKVKLFIRKQL